jgi:hypothetical protein
MQVSVGLIVLAMHFCHTDCRYALGSSNLSALLIELIVSFEVPPIAARLCTADLGWLNWPVNRAGPRDPWARRKNQNLVLVHKYMAQQSESELFVKTGHERAQTRQTASGHGLDIQFARTDPWKYSFAVKSVEHWNRLPEK